MKSSRIKGGYRGSCVDRARGTVPGSRKELGTVGVAAGRDCYFGSEIEEMVGRCDIRVKDGKS